jgi:DNA-binding NarL/FixJ family response regulator
MNSVVLDCKAVRGSSQRCKGLGLGAEANGGSKEAGSDDGPIRVVAVDDSPIVLSAVKAILEHVSGVVLVGTATDGYGAVRRVLELEPDLVLMDLSLPGMNGLEATRQIKARPRAPAVILVTADDTPESRAAARAAGTDGFVGKERLFTELRAAIHNLFPEDH